MSPDTIQLMIYGGVIAALGIVTFVSFGLLIPLDSVQAVTGVSIIMGVVYGIAILAWILAIKFYSDKPENLTWLNTHLLFLVVLPATIGATAMNVTTVQNTRNMLAGKVATSA